MKTTNLIEHKQTSKQLQYLNRFVELVLDAIIVTDTNHKIIYANKALENLYGYSKEELIGNTSAMLNAKPMSVEIEEDINRTIKKGETWLGSILKRKRDGSTFTCQCKVAPYYGCEGQIEAYITINREITNLERWEKQHQAIMQAATSGFITRTMDGKTLEVNDTYCNMIGYNRNELLEMSLSEIEVMENIDDIIRHIQKIKKQKNDSFETKHRCKGGNLIDVAVSANYLDIGEGQIFIFVRDITQRKEAERAVIESEQKYRDLYDNAPITYLTADTNGYIIQSNKAAQNWLGYSEEELRGIHVFDIYAKESESKARLVFERLKLGKSTENEEMVYLKKGGQKIYGLLSVSPIIDLHDRVIASRRVVKDITERKYMDKQLSQYRSHLEDLVKTRTSQLSEANKQLENLLHQQNDMIKQRGDFTRALVHELKTPLTAVINSSEILTKQLKNKIELKLARNMLKGALNLNKRIDELLDLVKGEIGILKVTCRPINPVKLIREVVDVMNPEARKRGQSIILDVPRSLPRIFADRERSKQILMNLFSNAIKFNSAKGRLIIRATAEGTNIVFEIQDEGIGLTVEEQERLFEPYYRTENDRERLGGLGLGLALSKRLVELHKGKIWVKSQKGKGSTFIFSIPLATEVVNRGEEKYE